MHPDLEELTRQFDTAQDRLHRLAEAVGDEQWGTRPKDNAWSVGECVAHLTLTNNRYLPLISEAIDAAPMIDEPLDDAQPTTPEPMRRDFAGWLLSRMMEPPVRFKLPTMPAFVPAGAANRAADLATFDAAHVAVRELIVTMDGLDPTRIRLTSPFNERLRYSLFSALHILAAHERRHIWQAERVLKRLNRQQKASK
jgi:hypothetical protein